MKLSYNVFVETMREFGWDNYWDCLRYFSWSSEKIRLKQVFKLSDNIFVEIMKKFGQDVFWNCLTMFSLKRWGILAETSIEIVLEYICWSDEETRLKQVLKLSDNIFVEMMKKSGKDVFWNCLTMFSLNRWRNSSETSIEIVLDFFRWSSEEAWLKQVLKLSHNIFVLKWWRNPVKTYFEIVWQYFRWNDEEIRLRRILKLSYNVFVEALRQFGWYKFWDRGRMFPLRWWRN